MLLLSSDVSIIDQCPNICLNYAANDMGNRTTPSYVAFTDTERLIGDAAKNQVCSYRLTNPRLASCTPLKLRIDNFLRFY